MDAIKLKALAKILIPAGMVIAYSGVMILMFYTDLGFFIAAIGGLMVITPIIALDMPTPKIDEVITKREDELRWLLGNDYLFIEDNSRMNYGHIGNLVKNSEKQEPLLVIFPETFYVHDKEFPINTRIMKILEIIQEDYKELTRGENCSIITFKN